MSTDNSNETSFRTFPPGPRWYCSVTVLRSPNKPDHATLKFKIIEGTNETSRADLLDMVKPESGMKVVIYVFGTPIPEGIEDTIMRMLRREGPHISHLYQGQIESVIYADVFDQPVVGDLS